MFVVFLLLLLASSIVAGYIVNVSPTQYHVRGHLTQLMPLQCVTKWLRRPIGSPCIRCKGTLQVDCLLCGRLLNASELEEAHKFSDPHFLPQTCPSPSLSLSLSCYKVNRGLKGSQCTTRVKLKP